jgi:hypothetical protein
MLTLANGIQQRVLQIELLGEARFRQCELTLTH